jgi:flavin reductase (DIM6/NTAB) family NADH-FMN oxidoreductase RutF
MPPDSEPQTAAALGKIPSGLFILTARNGAEATGILVSFVQQCSFDPPQVTAAVRPHRNLADWLTEGVPFGLSILAAGQKNLVGHFARGFDAGQPAFEGIATTPTADGVPVLADALGYLACRVVGRCSGGDHDLVIGRVTAGRLQGDAAPYVHVRKNGLSY